MVQRALPVLGRQVSEPVDIGRTRNLPRNILMFQSTADAATPYEGALDMHPRSAARA